MMKQTKKLNENQIKQLLLQYLKQAYCIYSSFAVACVIETKIKRVYKYYVGVNVENTSYSLTICAERNALFQYVTQKVNNEEITALYLLAQNKKNEYKNGVIYPCGACLQTLSEFFKPNTKIICYSINNQRELYVFSDLLPQKFSLKEK